MKKLLFAIVLAVVLFQPLRQPAVNMLPEWLHAIADNLGFCDNHPS